MARQGSVPLADRGANRAGYERFRHHGLRLRGYRAPWSRLTRSLAFARKLTVPRLAPADRIPYSRSGFAKPQAQEAAMSTGLILLVLIGVIAAFGWTRLRGKMKLGVSGKHWLGPIVVVGLVLLLMWSSHTTGH
jgi:hypothetical protein